MSKYEELMALINKPVSTPTQDKSLMDYVKDVAIEVDAIASKAYANTIDAVGDTYGAAKVNVLATPELFNNGVKRGEERAAAVLVEILTRK